MKRSEINAYIREAEEIFGKQGYLLPPWASWSAADWLNSYSDCSNVFASSLGWDLTDFGSGSYLKRGLLLITIRNGNNLEDQKPYAEKIMLVKENQETPYHFHWSKTEDIINRGGGNLVLQLHNSDKNESLAGTDIDVLTDGIIRTVAAGGFVVLEPGESITLKNGLYHRFFAEEGKGPVIAGAFMKDAEYSQPLLRMSPPTDCLSAIMKDSNRRKPDENQWNRMLSRRQSLYTC